MDSETGERVPDQETGEMPACAEVNSETGEAEMNRTAPEKQNSPRKFRIPNASRESAAHRQFATSEIVPCLLYLLSATLFLNPVVVACLGILEFCIHFWTHKKNKKMLDKGFCYQSPLHLCVREFCGACLEKRSKNKIIRIQDKRNYKFIKYGIDYSQGFY